MRSTSKLPDAVEEALSRGFSVIPISRNKLPAIKWKPYQERKADREQVLRWDREKKPSAWGVVTGGVSGLVVLDFDGDAGNKLLKKYRLEPHVRTGSGGAHAYVKHPGWNVGNFASKTSKELSCTIPGLDLRGDGGYVVISGSNAKGRYQQLRPLEPLPIEAVPPELRKLCHLDAPPREAQPVVAVSHRNGTQHPHGERVDPERLVNEALAGVASEGRNARGFWLATQLRDNGYSEVESEGIVLNRYRPRVGNTNTKGQAEPYTETEALASVHDAYKHPPREPLAQSARKAKTSPVEPPAVPAAPNSEQPTESFECEPDGLYWTRIKSDEHGVRKIRTRLGPPAKIEAVAHTAEQTGYGVLVAFEDDRKRHKRVIIPRKLLYGDGADALAELIDRGYLPASGNHDKNALKRYLITKSPQRWITHVPRVGWQGDSFVLPDETLRSESTADDVIFHTEEPSQHRFIIAGTLEDWQQNVGRLCRNNTRLLFAVSCAFAAPLLHKARLENAGFHFKGLSSTGKTLALLCAGSVFGGHPKDGFIQTWRATSNGLEAQASLHNDCLLALDEIGQVAAKDLAEVIYCIGNGQGKARANKSGTARSLQSFRLLTLSTGERSIEELIESAGGSARGGHAVRLIEIPADACRGFGVFEHLHDFKTGADFAGAIGTAARSYYGSAIRAFLTRFLQAPEDGIERANRMRRDFIDTYTVKNASSETERKLKFFGHVAAAGELATLYGVVPWDQGDATRAAADCFKAHLEAQGGAGPRDVERGMATIRQFIETHGRSRFFRIGVDEAEQRLLNVVGYVGAEYIDGAEETVYFVRGDTLQKEILGQYDAQAVVRELNRRKLLLTTTSGDKPRLQYSKKLPVPGSKDRLQSKWVYAIRQGILTDTYLPKT